MTEKEIEFREMFRIMLFENRLSEKIPVKIILENVSRSYFPTAQNYVLEMFQNDLVKILKPFLDEEDDLTEHKFIEAMVSSTG